MYLWTHVIFKIHYNSWHSLWYPFDTYSFCFFVGHALDDLNLDDIDINSIDRELDKDEVNSLSSSLSAGIPTSGMYVVTLEFYSDAFFLHNLQTT